MVLGITGCIGTGKSAVANILSEMNNLIQRLGVENKIMMSGVGMSSDINEAIKKLDKGEIGFSEALKIVKI